MENARTREITRGISRINDIQCTVTVFESVECNTLATLLLFHRSVNVFSVILSDNAKKIVTLENSTSRTERIESIFNCSVSFV